MHERAHAALEPLTIWVRSDPNHLQRPEKENKEKPKAEAKPEKSETAPEKKRNPVKADARPKAYERAPASVVPPEELLANIGPEVTMPAPKVPRPNAEVKPYATPERTSAMPVYQELPRLDIRPRHFYTEPEVRQPNQTEIEHDILPPLIPLGETHAPEQSAPKPEQAVEEQPLTPAMQLHELAAQKAKRAEGLEMKHQDIEAPELPEIKPAAPTAEVSEHVRAITDGEFETNTSMGMDELLEVAESVRIDGVSIAEMFRAERIDEEGLHRIISDFLRGRRIERAVAEEVLRQQMRFERDPQLRQIPLSATRDEAMAFAQANQREMQRRVFNAQTMRRQADKIADRLAVGIDRTVEAAENNPNIAKTVGTIVAVIAYFVVLILIIRS